MRLVGSWLIGLGVGSMTLAVARGNAASIAFPFMMAVAGFLVLRHSRQAWRRFPSTDLERALDRLFALLLPTRTATTAPTFRVVLAQRARLAGWRQGARRWSKELQLITTDGYETTSRLSVLRVPAGEHDERALAVEALRVLRAERADAGADLTLADDEVSMLAYGLGARPAEADLTSLEELLGDLGLSGEGDELRTHFDDIMAALRTGAGPRIKTDADRSMFRDLAGASFVLGASARILELASLTPGTPIPVGERARLST